MPLVQPLFLLMLVGSAPMVLVLMLARKNGLIVPTGLVGPKLLTDVTVLMSPVPFCGRRGH